MKISILSLDNNELKKRDVFSWPIWSCEISEFDWKYEDRESCYILEGQIEVVTDFETVTINPGDYVIFPKGLKCIWKVSRPVKKHYFFG